MTANPQDITPQEFIDWVIYMYQAERPTDIINFLLDLRNEFS